MLFIASTLNLSLSSHVLTINYRECFFPLISSRFRRALEPHVNPTPQLHRRKGLKASGNLLIGFSGGLGSSVLLDLVHKTYLTLCERQEGDQNPNGGCPWPEIFVATVDISRALNLVRSSLSPHSHLFISFCRLHLETPTFKDSSRAIVLNLSAYLSISRTHLIDSGGRKLGVLNLTRAEVSTSSMKVLLAASSFAWSCYSL